MEINEIKSRLSINQVLTHYHLTSDRNNRLLCPWHNDKTPSLQVYPKTNTWTCFSTNCSAGSGDVIEMILRMESLSGPGCTKHGAILKAKQMVDPSYASAHPQAAPMPPTALPPRPDNGSAQARIAVLTKYYQATLTALPRSVKAQEYAKSRCIPCEKLGIGYSGTNIGNRWNKNLHEAGTHIGILKKSGQTYKPKINFCLLFAMRNKNGQIVDVYGRSIYEKPNAKHFYLSGTQQGLYPGYPKSDTRKLILTESHLDAATLLAQSDIIQAYGVVTLYGCKGFTEAHREAIRELELLEEVIFFMDGDPAGEEAIKKWTPEILQEKPGIKISYVDTPKGEDINSLLQGHEPAILSHLLTQRKPVPRDSTFLFSTEKEKSTPQIQASLATNTTQQPVVASHLNQLDSNNTELLTYTTPEIKITVLGGIRITGLDRLKVTLKIESTLKQMLPVRHTLDLYHARQVEPLAEMISEQLEVRSSRAHQIISHLTSALEGYRQRRLELMAPKTPEVQPLTPQEKETGLHYLKDPYLLINTSKDIKASGIVGEEKNALIGFIIYLTRKRKSPLHVMYLGSSGSGKTHLQESLAALIPEEDKEEATSLSDQALPYEGKKLKGKILFIEDLDGADNVQYLIREFQTKGRLVKRVAYRDNKGHTQTIKIVAEGPVLISSCTTREKVYEDNANRCILLYIDESEEQDKRVLDYLKSKSAGQIMATEEQRVRDRLQQIQKLLKPIRVVNPYAGLIDLPQEVFKPRRSLPLLLGFIETITFYHQYQREIKTEDHQGQVVEPYIETTYEDIKYAFDLLKEVLFSKSDELTKASRCFLEKIKDLVKNGETFNAGKIRQELRLNASNMKRYMYQLQRYGYLKIKGGNRYRGYEYQIVDYTEYEQLKNVVDRQLEAILLKINQISGPVVHSGPKSKMDHIPHTVSTS